LKEAIMGERANTLVQQFEKAVADLAAEIEKLPDDRWSNAKTEEGWTVAAAAQHVSGQFPLEMEYITAFSEGRPAPAYSWDDVNAKNDGRAAQNTAVSKQAVLDELKTGAASVSAYLRGLSDEQLDAKTALPLANGAEVSTQQIIEGGVLIDHVRGHLQSIRAAR
jgi:uncharacterized damage-inducible protein DinB